MRIRHWIRLVVMLGLLVTAGSLPAEEKVVLERAKVPVEMHIFSKGGHGYGLRPSDDPVSNWPRLCEQWMRVSGLLDPAPGKIE